MASFASLNRKTSTNDDNSKDLDSGVMVIDPEDDKLEDEADDEELLNIETGDEEIKDTLVKISKSAKIRVKEASIKIGVGKTSMTDENVIGNIKSVYEGILQALPLKMDNVRNVLVKLTMTKPIEVQIK